MIKVQESVAKRQGVDITAHSRINLMIGAGLICSGLWGLVVSAMVA